MLVRVETQTAADRFSPLTLTKKVATLNLSKHSNTGFVA